jgi:hypothetical protein
MFGSEIAIALGRFGTRLVHRECQAQKSLATKRPLAFVDQTRKRSERHFLNVSPIGRLGAVCRGGGSVGGPVGGAGVGAGG